MQTDTRSTQEQASERRLILILITSFMGISGAVTGTVVFACTGALLEPWLGFQPTWWMGLFLGSAIGGIAGLYQARSVIRRTAEFSSEASALNLAPLSSEDTKQVNRNIGGMFVGKDTRLWDAHFNQAAGSKVVLGDFGIEDSMEHDTDGNNPEKQQTCLYMEFDFVKFPEFQVHPKKLGVSMLGSILGTQEILFSGTPAFSKGFQVAGRPTEIVRELLGVDFRTLVSRHSQTTVMAKHNRLLIYQNNRLCEIDELRGFLNRGLEIARSLHQDAKDIPVEALNHDQTKASIVADANETSGLLGFFLRREIKNKLVDTNMLTSFLAQPTPRPIPKQLKNHFKADRFLIGLGSFLVVFGVALGVLGFMTSTANSSAVTGAIGFALGTLGTTIVFFVWMLTQRKLKILTEGAVRHATLSDLRKTGVVSGNQRIFEVKVCLPNLKPGSASPALPTRIQGAPVAAARALAESGELTRVLQHPKYPSQVLLIECYAVPN